MLVYHRPGSVFVSSKVFLVPHHFQKGSGAHPTSYPEGCSSIGINMWRAEASNAFPWRSDNQKAQL